MGGQAAPSKPCTSGGGTQRLGIKQVLSPRGLQRQRNPGWMSQMSRPSAGEDRPPPFPAPCHPLLASRWQIFLFPVLCQVPLCQCCAVGPTVLSGS